MIFRPYAFATVCLFGVLLPAVSQQADLSSQDAAQNSDSGTGQSQSLADMARKLRKDKTTEVRMTDVDTKKLFESVDKIFAFASEDTGMPKRAVVKRQLVSKADVEKFASGRLAKEEYICSRPEGSPDHFILSRFVAWFNVERSGGGDMILDDAGSKAGIGAGSTPHAVIRLGGQIGGRWLRDLLFDGGKLRHGRFPEFGAAGLQAFVVDLELFEEAKEAALGCGFVT